MFSFVRLYTCIPFVCYKFFIRMSFLKYILLQRLHHPCPFLAHGPNWNMDDAFAPARAQRYVGSVVKLDAPRSNRARWFQLDGTSGGGNSAAGCGGLRAAPIFGATVGGQAGARPPPPLPAPGTFQNKV